MVEGTATVQNSAGIHCRPSAVIVKELSTYPGEVKVVDGGNACDPRSILGLIAMGLCQGATVTVRVEGPDEADWLKKTVELFERIYDFPKEAS